VKVHHLDGDEIRKIFTHTGYSKEERENHIQRVAHLASQLEMNGIVVVVSLVSPFEASRNFARTNCKNFIEVYVNTPFEVCQQRDVKGLYKKAANGEIKNFTGIGQDYEVPRRPEVTVNTADKSIKECSNIILESLNQFLC
jgi:adenylylsulfate kinase